VVSELSVATDVRLKQINISQRGWPRTGSQTQIAPRAKGLIK